MQIYDLTIVVRKKNFTKFYFILGRKIAPGDDSGSMVTLDIRDWLASVDHALRASKACKAYGMHKSDDACLCSMTKRWAQC